MKHDRIVREIDVIASEIKDEIKNDKYRQMKKKCGELCKKHSELSKLDGYLTLPSDTSLPFFAYGIFKPGQVSFSRIKPFIKEIIEDRNTYINYTLYERDGIPIVFEEDGNGRTRGSIIIFNENDSEEAYDIIRRIESKIFYRWSKKPISVNGIEVNMLFGKKHGKSNPISDGDNYDGAHDVFFEYAVSLIAKDMKEYEIGNNSFRNFFALQRNYMLLWAAIERYASLKYGENSKMGNNKELANEKIFKNALKLFVEDFDENCQRVVYSSDNIKRDNLDPNDSVSSINYYYTMRSNVVHRGKSVIPIDEENLRKSLLELLCIFQLVLKDTFEKYKIKPIKHNINGIGLNNKVTLIEI